jgi:hypothetical protein
VFFVKETKPRVVIGVVSVAIGLVVDIALLVYRRTHEDFFLNQHGRLFDMLVRFIAGFAIAVIVCFSTCAVYNICKR